MELCSNSQNEGIHLNLFWCAGDEHFSTTNKPKRKAIYNLLSGPRAREVMPSMHIVRVRYETREQRLCLLEGTAACEVSEILGAVMFSQIIMYSSVDIPYAVSGVLLKHFIVPAHAWELAI